jgi:4-hydroxy-tetrahydrodipicolinate synthase
MVKKFRGLYVPLVTPFANGQIDTKALSRLITFVLEGGADGLVIFGTTGEGTSLSRVERLETLELVMDEVQGRAPIIAGLSGNNTSAMIDEVIAFTEKGPDGLMIVCPYYNRPSQKGLITHFRTLAGETDLPIIIYNIPQRTGVKLEPESVAEILDHVGNIAGIKESSPRLGAIVDLIAQVGDRISVLTGEDTFGFPALCLGADGWIAAVGNVLVSELADIFRAVQQSDLVSARAIHFRIRPMVGALFSEPNPGPMKAALDLMGLLGPEVRLPLMAATPTCVSNIQRELSILGKI